MVEEYNSIMKNDVWDIVPRLEGKSVVYSRWLYKVKHAAIGSIDKYKAWFIVRGFYKREGVDYEDTFAPVARYTSIRTITSLASVFGVISDGCKDNKLKKALNELKQAPHPWYSRMDEYLRFGIRQNFGRFQS
jgi:hypothetical protein